MRKSLFMSVLAMGLLSGCQNEMENVIETTLSESKVVIAASLETKTESRTSLQEEGNDVFKVLWSAEDKLGIFYYSSAAHNKFKLIDGAGESNATFESDGTFKVVSGTEGGNTSDFACVAYYPYAENTTATKNNDGSYTIGTSIAVNQTYADNSFGENNFPMLAVSDNLNFSFKNAASILRMPLKGSAKIVKATLTSASKKIAGPYSVKMSEINGTWTPSIEGQGLGVTDGGSSMIVLECTEPVQLDANTAQNFLFVIPPGTYAANDLTVKFYDEDNKYYSTTITEENIFNRSEVLTFNERTYENPQDAGISEANTALKAGVENVNVTVANTDDNPTLELPASTSGNPTNVNFESIPSGKTVTVTASTESNNQEAKEVNLSVPASQEGYSFNINLPNSTVTLGANGESATYNEVTAATAVNTLIISKEVTVKTLKIKKGHVKVHGKIENISREENSDEVTYIIKGEDAEITGTVGDGCLVVSAAEYDLITKFKQGGTQTIALEGDVELTQPLTLNDASANITIDLGTFSLTNNTAYDYDNCGKTECYVFEVQAGTLNITGTTGSVNAVGGSDYDMAVFANTNGVVNINGGKFTNTGKADDGSDLIYARDNAAITISGGEFEAGNKSSDVGNQYVALNIKDNSAASITVTGGKFHKFNPAYNVSENPKKNFAGNNTMVAVSGTEGNEVYDVIDLSDGYTMTSDIKIATPITINTTGSIDFNLGTYSLTNETAYDYDNCGETECYVFEVQAGTLNISGTGSVNAIGGSDYDMAVFANTNGVVNINGGKFTNTGKANDGSDLIYARDNAAITISGGEFEAGNKSSDVGNQYVALNIKDNSEASITVTGGKFHKFNPAYNVSENPKKNFAGNNTMVAVSGTEGNEVYDVIDLSNGYTMTSDIEIATPITINTTGSIDFNLGTYSLTNETAYDYDNCGETECYVFEVQAGTLNISGTGSVNAIGGSDFDMAVFANTSGVVNINGGKFTNKGIENDGSDLIYVRDNAKVAITGGEFEAGNKSKDVGDGNIYVALNLRDNDNTTASITVSGGKFKNFDPANPGTETAAWNQTHTNGFVEANYSSTKSEDDYYVVSETASAE